MLESVCDRTHTILKQRVTVVEYAPVELPQTQVVVTGLETDEDGQEMLGMYFESEKRSGGGDVEDVRPGPQEGQAIITFSSAEGGRNLRIVFAYFIFFFLLLACTEEERQLTNQGLCIW